MSPTRQQGIPSLARRANDVEGEVMTGYPLVAHFALRALPLLACLSLGCAKPPAEEQPSVEVPPPQLKPLEDLAEARRQAKEQNRPLVVLNVLGDYKKHC
ncbi:MAG: hypothetical protein K2R98_30015 [Gemmataceae bacterium]|nr:hypothetical protein [Gemmataceae bacterium]